jgi:hypothetical protein
VLAVLVFQVLDLGLQRMDDDDDSHDAFYSSSSSTESTLTWSLDALASARKATISRKKIAACVSTSAPSHTLVSDAHLAGVLHCLHLLRHLFAHLRADDVFERHVLGFELRNFCFELDFLARSRSSVSTYLRSSICISFLSSTTVSVSCLLKDSTSEMSGPPDSAHS